MINRKIQIFVDAHVFDGEFQGTRTYIYELYIRILKNNPNWNIYFAAKNISNLKKAFGSFQNAFYIKYNSTTRYKRIFIEIPRIIKQQECTHAHFQYVSPLKKVSGCKYIVTIHDILFNDFPEEFSFSYRFKRNILFYLSAKWTDYLLTVSNYSKTRIASKYRIRLENIVVTPNGVSSDFMNFEYSKEASRYHIKKKYDKQKFLLYVSRIEPRKNQTMLLNIFFNEELWKQGYTLIFIGKNSLQSNFFEEVEKLSNDEKSHVTWFEQIEFSDLKHFYNAAELFVYPSKAEGFGIPPLEAAALRTPVVCSNQTAMQDFVFFKPYMCDPENQDEMAAKVVDILQEHNNIKINSIKNTIEIKYSWDKPVQVLSEILEEK